MQAASSDSPSTCFVRAFLVLGHGPALRQGPQKQRLREAKEGPEVTWEWWYLVAVPLLLVNLYVFGGLIHAFIVSPQDRGELIPYLIPVGILALWALAWACGA